MKSFVSPARTWIRCRHGLGLVLLCTALSAYGQDTDVDKGTYTPLLSGGAAFLTSTNGGNTTYLPLIEPLLAAPIGKHFLLEGRAALDESFFPVHSKGYDHSHFVGNTYFQMDYLATRHLTIVGGDYLIPFGTYNERLSPVWINNLQDGPLIASIGLMNSGSGLGGEVRGSAVSTRKYSIDYAAYFSARSGNEQFNSSRSSGGRASIYLPEQRLEVGLSYGRLLQGTHENFYGTHVWYQPKDTALRLRSEFARGHHAQGYWIEADYRTERFGGLNSWVGRIEPVLRLQQTWRRDTVVSDGVPLVNTERVDFGLNYNLPHSTRILTSYSRQFSSTRNVNIWQTGIVYRFLFRHGKARVSKMAKSNILHCTLALAGTWLGLVSVLGAQGGVKVTSPAAQSKTHTAAPAAIEEDGDLVYARNCSRCHAAPDSLPHRVTGTVLRHMRVRANLSAADEKALLRFFNPL